MGVVAISVIIASVLVWILRRPPLVEIVYAIWRRDPPDRHPPRTSLNEFATSSLASPATSIRAGNSPAQSTSSTKHADLETAISGAQSGPSAASTPKIDAAVPNGEVPLLSLSPDPRASATSIVRANGATASPTSTSLAGSAPAPSGANIPLSTLMPPPPSVAPPTLKPLSNSNLSPSPTPGRLVARQSGTSTLAPPPTHSSKPGPPSRQVTLAPGHSPLDWARLTNHPTADLRNVPPGTPYLKVSPSMLKQQKGRKGKDAWTSLGGRVYNIQPYLPFHPGGQGELLRAAGRDGTKLFGEIHPWVNYETMLESCLIGILVSEHEVDKGVENKMDAMD